MKKFNPILIQVKNASTTYISDICKKESETFGQYTCTEKSPNPYKIPDPIKSPGLYRFDNCSETIKPGIFMYRECSTPAPNIPPKCKLTKISQLYGK
jgi:hypothetical protein